MKKTRKDRRDIAAENLCREVRFQLAKEGRIFDNTHLSELLIKWMKHAKKNKYERP